jgi:tetratricopeptide (TPR) repeat protein
MGKTSESLEEFTKALEIYPTMKEALLGRGNVLAALGDLEKSRKDYTRAIFLYPTCTEAYVNIGYSLQKSGNDIDARNVFTTALTIDPNCAMAFEARAVACLNLNAHLQALADISSAVVYVSNSRRLSLKIPRCSQTEELSMKY